MANICMSHVTHMNEPRHTYGWVTSHTCMSHVTHTQKSCVSQISNAWSTALLPPTPRHRDRGQRSHNVILRSNSWTMSASNVNRPYCQKSSKSAHYSICCTKQARSYLWGISIKKRSAWNLGTYTKEMLKSSVKTKSFLLANQETIFASTVARHYRYEFSKSQRHSHCL